MSNSIFPVLSLDRNKIHWEDYLFTPTPVEKIGDMYFKREDKFAPLGYGGVNGSKLRQCIWLIEEYVKNSPNPVGLVSGTSVKSPQLPIGSSVAEHFGLRSVHVIGATNQRCAILHPNVELATWFGALFNIQSKVAYNPVLQSRVRKFLNEDKKLKDYFYLEYGITLDHRNHPKEKVEQFHRLGADQLQNLPEHIENIIISAGSYNSMVSVLYGVAKYKPKNLKNIYVLGIGPNKIKYVEDRLRLIGESVNLDTNIFSRDFKHSPKEMEFYRELYPNKEYQYNIVHHDLHLAKYVTYQDEMKFDYEGVEFHPTYEGKTMKYIKQFLPELWNEGSMYWIVGSKNRKESMVETLSQREYPNKILEYNNGI